MSTGSGVHGGGLSGKMASDNKKILGSDTHGGRNPGEAIHDDD